MGSPNSDDENGDDGSGRDEGFIPGFGVLLIVPVITVALILQGRRKEPMQ